MAITRWDPFQELNLITNRMNRLFQDSFGQGATGDEGLTTTAFVPPVDIYEDEHNITLKLEVPDSVSADYENGVLKIKLAKKAEAKPKQIKVNVGQGQKTIDAGKGKAA
jgi:HSP20 family protein